MPRPLRTVEIQRDSERTRARRLVDRGFARSAAALADLSTDANPGCRDTDLAYAVALGTCAVLAQHHRTAAIVCERHALLVDYDLSTTMTNGAFNVVVGRFVAT